MSKVWQAGPSYPRFERLPRLRASGNMSDAFLLREFVRVAAEKKGRVLGGSSQLVSG